MSAPANVFTGTMKRLSWALLLLPQLALAQAQIPPSPGGGKGPVDLSGATISFDGTHVLVDQPMQCGAYQGVQGSGSKYGSTYSGNFFGMRLPPNDNTVYYHTGSVMGGGHWFVDAAGNPFLRVQPDGIYVGDALAPTVKLVMKYGTSAASPGSATTNRAAGRAAIANGASSATVTNSVVAATSVVECFLETPAAGVAAVLCVPGSGSFVATSVNGTGIATNATADATFSFVVVGTN